MQILNNYYSTNCLNTSKPYIKFKMLLFVKDMRGKLCKKTGRACSGNCSSGPVDRMTYLVFADTQWFKPTTEEEVTKLLEQYKGKKIRFLLGNTAHGIASLLPE